MQEPGSCYIGHVTPASGTAIDISKCILNFLDEHEARQFLVAVGCDGTNVNTGHKGGVIRLLEKDLKYPLQWIVCLLHFNELPLRHLMHSLDGTTSGPNTFCGTIGKQLEKCESLPVCSFKKINVDLPDVDDAELSKDQKYLYAISMAIQSGVCSEDLARQDPGRLAHSRWLTAANRMLRLYVATARPSANLKVLVSFVLKVYVPSWFAIKIKHSVVDGSKLLFEIVERSRYLPKKHRDVVDPVISSNAYFAHQENVLLSMLADERQEVRKMAVQRILSKRLQAAAAKCGGADTDPRIFRVPIVNFQATQYTEMVDWPKDELFEPPILSGTADEAIQSCVEDCSKVMTLVGDFPCHTQAVERTVKLVTQAAMSVCGAEARDGYIKSTLRSRKIMPKFNTKKDFVAASSADS